MGTREVAAPGVWLVPRICTTLCWAYSYRGQRCVVFFLSGFANRGLNSEQQDWDMLSDFLREALAGE